jgi:transposase InsO family protein
MGQRAFVEAARPAPLNSPRFWVESVPTGDGHAQEQIYRRADHQGAEGTRGRVVGWRFVPEARHRFRILTLVDDFTQECLDLVVDTLLTGLHVARDLDRIVELRSYACMIVSDNGTELWWLRNFPTFILLRQDAASQRRGPVGGAKTTAASRMAIRWAP